MLRCAQKSSRLYKQSPHCCTLNYNSRSIDVLLNLLLCQPKQHFPSCLWLRNLLNLHSTVVCLKLTETTCPVRFQTSSTRDSDTADKPNDVRSEKHWIYNREHMVHKSSKWQSEGLWNKNHWWCDQPLKWNVDLMETWWKKVTFVLWIMIIINVLFFTALSGGHATSKTTTGQASKNAQNF